MGVGTGDRSKGEMTDNKVVLVGFALMFAVSHLFPTNPSLTAHE